ncbi:MAG: hypothetical protein ABIV13_04245 [Fimbriimonadales bacterium]
MNSQLLFGMFFALLPIGFLCIAIGYFLFVCEVWHRPDRKEQLKLIFASSKSEEWQRRPRAAGVLILIGAMFGVVGGIGIVASALF